MSAYGPAVFCKRVDEKELSANEQDEIEALVEEACEDLEVVDDWEEEPVSPWRYDYDGYEQRSVSFVLWSNHVFGGAPPFIQEDFHKKARKLAIEIGKWIDEKKPDTYEYDGYYVEC